MSERAAHWPVGFSKSYVIFHKGKFMSTAKDKSIAWGRIVAKCWLDEKFKQELLSNPIETLTKHGYPVEEHCKITVLANTESETTLSIPPKPKDISDESVINLAASSNSGGGSGNTGVSAAF